MNKLKEIWQYREMINSFVKKEIRARYQKSVLGVLWNYINPLVQIAVYTFVFTLIFRSDVKVYYLFLTTAMMPWNFFSDSLNHGSSAIVNNADMVKKIYFPREVLVISTVNAKFVNLVISMIFIFAASLVAPIRMDPYRLWIIPLIMIIEYLQALGLALIAAAVTVFLRDVQFIINVVLMAWIWMTPVMYSLDNVPAGLGKVLLINPMTWTITAFRDVLYYNRYPTVMAMLIPLVEGIIFVIIGEMIFSKKAGKFAEEL